MRVQARVGDDADHVPEIREYPREIERGGVICRRNLRGYTVHTSEIISFLIGTLQLACWGTDYYGRRRREIVAF